jgi:hypothetical protein
LFSLSVAFYPSSPLLLSVHSFDDDAHDLLNLMELEFEAVVHATQALATTTTSHAIQTETQWPEILLPHFELQGMGLSELAKIAQLNIVPLVYAEAVEAWQAFSIDNQGWIKDGLHVQSGNESTSVDSITSFVYRLEDDGIAPQTGQGISGRYSPVWLQYPAPSDPIMVNFDLLSSIDISDHYNTLLKKNALTFSNLLDLDFLLSPNNSGTNDAVHTFLMQPLYFDFSNTKTQDLVGYVLTIFSWKDIFESIIHSDDRGIALVLSSTCGNSLTFHTSTRQTTMGDLHDSDFDNLAVSLDLGTSLSEDSEEEFDHCSYRATAYPTAELQDSFLSSTPWLYGVLAVLLFFFTTVVFGLYDFFVYRRQRELIVKAERTNKLVSELFPSNVKDRLLDDGGSVMRKGSTHFDRGSMNRASSMRSIDGFATDMTLVSRTGSVSNRINPYQSRPIADLFPSATVMFGDLVGFTAW